MKIQAFLLSSTINSYVGKCLRRSLGVRTTSSSFISLSSCHLKLKLPTKTCNLFPNSQIIAVFISQSVLADNNMCETLICDFW
ncbi:unnamed protein product [Moneuplotes crassus]|uniref:Uncharacterized protein n=1 Tax=Euplotes crassus TaxID=5936 RepID=A0AAD2D9S4_EUPCR|nr:unnamed protein product [Moneuplotes crassus]